MPSANDAATLSALFSEVDQARTAAELVWGAERLPLLVPEDTRAKFLRQRIRFRTALEAAWGADNLTGEQIEAARSAAGGMIRAYGKLAELASEAGHRPLSVEVWETTLKDGTVVAVCRTNDEAAKAVHEGRHLVVYTLAEVANIIQALPEALQMAKTVWPGAKVLPPAEAGPWTKFGDAIPFGDSAEIAA